MNILDLDLQSIIPEITEIYVEIFGEDFRKIIEDRIGKTKYIYYRTSSGAIGYHAFLRYCKSKELGIRFLKEIGVEIDYEKEGSNAEPYTKETEEMIANYLGSSFIRIGFMDEKYSLSGIKSFDEERLLHDDDYYYEQRYFSKSQIRLLNYLRGSEEITEDNYDEFKETQEFKELKKRIEQYYRVYKSLLGEYNQYMEQIAYYNIFAKRERTRQINIANKYDNNWEKHAEDIENEVIETSEDYLENAQFLGDTRNCEKMRIVINNNFVCVQEMLGTRNSMLFFNVRGYNDGGKIDYMLLHEICHVIGTIIREKTDEEIVEDSNQDIKRIKGIRTEYVSGKKVKSGLDCLSDFAANPYDECCRKYERLNETITDLFAVEARKRLHGRGVYLVEGKEICIEDVIDFNTSERIKKMVAPLVKKFSKKLKYALVSENIEALTDAIGTENFEELNDCINLTDAIIRGSIHREYSKEEREEAISKQEDRCKRIYRNIDNYRKKRDRDDVER